MAAIVIIRMTPTNGFSEQLPSNYWQKELEFHCPESPAMVYGRVLPIYACCLAYHLGISLGSLGEHSMLVEFGGVTRSQMVKNE